MKIFRYLLFLFLLFCTMNVNADTDEFSFNGSKIGGLGYGTSSNNININANTYNNISLNLLLNYYHYYGEVESPIKSNDTTNVMFVSCIHKDAIINGLFSSHTNYLDISYVSDDKCTFSWESTPIDGRVQYTFARLKYSSSDFDQIDSESGTIYNWFYKFNSQSIGVQGLSFNSALYFTDIRYLTSSEYNSLVSQYRSLKEQNGVQDKINDTNSKLDEAENTRKGIWGTIKEVLSNIISLPKKIAESLVDALKSLFIPTESQISEVIDDSKELSENFGFVGEAVSFSVQLFTSLLNISQSNGCVDFPEFSLDFSNIDSIGYKVKFWDKKSVCLADNQWFGSNFNGIVVVRSLSTIFLIIVFLNFCYKAFFRVLSKEC